MLSLALIFFFIQQFLLTIDFSAIPQAQQEDTELQQIRQSTTSLKFLNIPVPGTNFKLTCDISTGTYHPYLPRLFRYSVFESLHGLSHHGV